MTRITAIHAVDIRLQELPLPGGWMQCFASMEIDHHLSRPAECRMVWDGCEILPDALDVFQTGMALTVSSETLQHSPLFAGQVTGIRLSGQKSGLSLEITARDELYKLQCRQPVRAHVASTLRETFARLLAETGLRLEADEEGPFWQQRIQSGCTDLEYLQQLAAGSGYYFHLDQQRCVHLSRPVFELQPLMLDAARDLLEFQVEDDHAGVVDRIQLSGWDPWRAAVHRIEVQHPAAGSPLATGIRVDRHYGGICTQNEEQLLFRAEALLQHQQAASHHFSAVCETALAPGLGQSVQLCLSTAAITRPRVVTHLCHRLAADGGLTTFFSSEPPAPPAVEEGNQLALGLVTQVEDPEQLGRVKVRMPAYDNMESEWLEVMQTVAGPDKGLVALPDVGDRVLLLFCEHRPEQAVVLGGVFGEQSMPESMVDADRVQRFLFRSPDGQLLRLDDQQGSVTLQNSSGSRVTLAGGKLELRSAHGHRLVMEKDAMRLHAEGDLEIEAPGHTLTIAADKIDFSRR